MRIFRFEAILLLGALWVVEGEGVCRVPDLEAQVAECTGNYRMERAGWTVEFGKFRLQGEEIAFLDALRLRGREADVRAKGGRWGAQGLLLRDTNGRWGEWEFAAETLQWREGRVVLTGRVVCRRGEQELRGQRVEFREEGLWVEGGAQIQWKEGRISAEALSGRETRWQIQGPLAGRWGNAEGMTFSAEAAELTEAEVRLREAYIAWSAGEARADEVQLNLRSAEIVLKGRVSGQFRGKRFQARRVIWSQKEQALRLEGAVRVWFPRSVFQPETD